MGVPPDTDGITPEWLTAALYQAGALDQARVTSIQPAPIGQPGFTGQIRRLQIGYDKPERCAPRSLVAKFSATHPEARAAVHSMGFTSARSGSIARSLLTARSVRLGVISVKSRWIAVRRYCSLRTSVGCITWTRQVVLWMRRSW